MKVAPIIRAIRSAGIPAEPVLVHTGQHYDYQMSETFFRQLELPPPAASLNVGSGTHATQTAQVMLKYDAMIAQDRPNVVLVVGDVNSTLACALVAAKEQIPLVHVEAGLRSGDRSMPEEINRIVTDRLADRLYVTEPSGVENLRLEGVEASRIKHVGNVMIDNLLWALDRVPSVEDTLAKIGAPFERSVGYGLVTLHRPSNVDSRVVLSGILEELARLAIDLPLVFPVHPRTRKVLNEAVSETTLLDAGIHLVDPLGYFEMVGLLRGARMVLTDSGGLQEETTALGIPCLTLRNNTERPITIDEGTNRLVGNKPDRIRAAIRDVMASVISMAPRCPQLWDGKASVRIVDDIHDWVK